MEDAQLSPEIKKENIIDEVVKPVEVIIKDSSSIINNVKIIVIILGIIGVGFGIFKGCSCFPNLPFKIGPTVIKNADPNQPTVITSTSVTYTPKINGKDGKPIKVSKPVEGKVTIDNGIVKIQNSGFTLVPKLGGIYSFGDKKFELAGGARLLFVSSFGFETLLNDQRLFIGLDVRDPIFNSLTTSVGISSPYLNIGQISPYFGEEATLLSF